MARLSKVGKYWYGRPVSFMQRLRPYCNRRFTDFFLADDDDEVTTAQRTNLRRNSGVGGSGLLIGLVVFVDRFLCHHLHLTNSFLVIATLLLLNKSLTLL